MRLPESFFPSRTFDLVRVGGAGDGGYLVERASLGRASSLLGFGIGTDWAFEKDFLGFGDGSVVLEAYDLHHPWRHIRTGLLRFWRPSKCIGNAFKLIDCWLFFRGPRRFHKKAVGLHPLHGGQTLADVIKESKPPPPMFLKVDVEGSEYRMLDDLAAHADEICGLVVEFHDVDLHRDRIENFIKRFGLDLVHVHPNNAGGTDSSGNPMIMEMTFARNPRPVSEAVSIPHPLDRPNKDCFPDIVCPG